MFRKSRARIPALYTGWTFFTFICSKNCSFEKMKINKNKAGDGPFFKKVTV